MSKSEYFVSIGLKENGKIVKNEEYSIKEFTEKVIPIISVDGTVPEVSFWDFITGKSKKILSNYAKACIKSRQFDITHQIMIGIDMDVKGRKKRKKQN